MDPSPLSCTFAGIRQWRDRHTTPNDLIWVWSSPPNRIRTSGADSAKDPNVRSSSLPTTLTPSTKCKPDSSKDERVAQGFDGHHINGFGQNSIHIIRQQRSSSTAMAPLSTSPCQTTLRLPHRLNVQRASYPPATRSKFKDLNAIRMPMPPSTAALAAPSNIGSKLLSIPQPARALSSQDPALRADHQRSGRAVSQPNAIQSSSFCVLFWSFPISG